MSDFVPIFAIFIPLSAIVMGIGLAFWAVYWNHQKRQLQYQERQRMIEKGMVPPPMLLADERKTITPEDCLRRGTILLFLGIGLALGTMVLANFTNDEEFVGIVGVASAIVGSLGVGNLVYSFIARRNSENTARTL
jgi:hypothetical protein